MASYLSHNVPHHLPNYQPCCIIPNYNHALGFEKLIQRLAQLNLDIFIVNDGSNEETTELLNSLPLNYAGITVIKLPQNQGKGAAVTTGLLQAYKAGYSHGLQIDADGQHDLDDVGKFLAQSSSNPQAIVSGTAVYDKSAPLGRVFSRYITHFWVWVETLSFTIKDSMCGFRVYPLQATVAVVENSKLGQRMDFDTEILVRMYWNQVPVISLPTRVKYPEDGLSHFRLFQDNWLITKMHTRLFFGMLIRSPALVTRHFSRHRTGTKIETKPATKTATGADKESVADNSAGKQKHWSSLKERGSLLAIQSLFLIYKIFGRRLILLVLHPVILYFTLTSTVASRSSKQYFCQLAEYQGREAVVGWKTTYNHFYEFAVNALDKIGSWSGEIRRRDVSIQGEAIFDELVESKKGAVIIGSHLGNLELCRALGENDGRFKINAVVFNKNALKFQRVLSKSNIKVNLNLIHVERISIDTAILLKQKIEQGEAVVLVGDRTSVSAVGRVEYADFLGKQAPFSHGPFILAGLMECPVYLLFCLKQEDGYHVYFERFAESLKFPRKFRKQRLTQKIGQYAERLTYYCQQAPYQWFNFYDFWRCEDTERETPGKVLKMETAKGAKTKRVSANK